MARKRKHNQFEQFLLRVQTAWLNILVITDFFSFWAILI